MKKNILCLLLGLSFGAFSVHAMDCGKCKGRSLRNPGTAVQCVEECLNEMSEKDIELAEKGVARSQEADENKEHLREKINAALGG